MNYKIFTSKIETRTSGDKVNPEYIVRGYASIPNKLDWYKFDINQNMDGTYKIVSFRSLFTDNAVSSMKNQAKAKKVFVDAEHEIASVMNSKHLIEQMRAEAKSKGISIDTPVEQVLDYMRHSEIPFAKITDLSIDDKGLYIETKLNPAFRGLSDNHEKYFDSVWSSLQNGFINGMSINFQPTKVMDKFIDGKRIDVIDDLDFYGVSYTGQPALPENSIVEVFMRSAMEFREGKMEIRETQAQPVKEINVEEMKANIEKEVREKLEREFSEKEEKQKIENQKVEQQAAMERLQKELEEKNSKILEMEKTRKSVVSGTNTINRENQPDVTEHIKNLSVGEILGDSVVAKAVFNSMPEETQKAAAAGGEAIVVQAKNYRNQ